MGAVHAQDTTFEARKRVAAVHGAMSGAERVRHACAMADEAKEVALAGIRSRQPSLDEDDVALEWLRLLHGATVADRVARCSSSS